MELHSLIDAYAKTAFEMPYSSLCTFEKILARANSVKTLANFGFCHKNIIMSQLISMADDYVSRVVEAVLIRT